ncbi:MAG: hypothetical protein KatS3mg062_0329 [Tepidiforma sp.]|nr:MAG: hypothetical protein KatS3mg062_0329 [Tepidiforma sp.]
MLVDEDVFGFDVAVDDALAVGICKSIGELAAQPNRLAVRQSPLRLDELSERIPVDVLRDDVAPALVFAGVEDADDVRMLEASHDARLTLERSHCFGVDGFGERGVEEFDGDPSAEAKVLGEPDLSHAASTEQPFEAVSSVYDVRGGERQMTLQHLRTPERGAEAALLAGSFAVLLIGWRALAAADFSLPGGMVRIVAQAAVCVIAMHACTRVLAPRARPEVLPSATLLASLGIILVTRLAPGSAAQQANWLAVAALAYAAGLAAGLVPTRLRALTYTSGLLAVLTLVATGLFGETINGARLWVRIAGQSVQTTEFIKALVVLFLAGYLSDAAGALVRQGGRLAAVSVRGTAYILPLTLVLAGAMAALALLRDLGSIALLLLLSVAMLYVSTGRVRFAAGGLALVLITGLFGYFAFDHVKGRVDAWLDPYSDPAGGGYQSLQATYAVNAGGITGTGLGRGMPTVVPAASTDYVFAAAAEELGLAGAAGILVLYATLLHSGLRVAAEGTDSFQRLLAAAIALLIAIQAAVIIAGNLRLIPTTGITLPFVSYGGSSLVVNFGLVGLLVGLSQSSRAERS